MKSAQSRTVRTATASFPFSADFLPLATAFTEKAARGFACGERESNGLVLAVEEIFTFYLEQLTGVSGIELRLDDEHYQLRLTLRFRLANPDLRAFNMTYRVDPDNEESLAGLGLMIAARSVTRLRLDFGHDDEVSLQLTREKDYALAVPLPALPASKGIVPRVHDPEREDIGYFAALVAGAGGTFVPTFLARPGMAVDMLACGALGALLASAGDAVLGGVLWRRLSESTIELFGPYLFHDDPGDALLTQLLDAAVGRISRSGAHTLLRRQGRLAGYARFFDLLGELTLALPGVEATPAGSVWTHYYKQLREESGGTIYAPPPLADFLRAEYERLCLPRQVRESSFQDDGRRQDSLFSVDFEPRRSLATLRPLVAGRDMAENLAAHLALLEREGMRNAIVEIDAGRSADTAFAPALYAAGFLPRLLLPEAGKGDLVIFAR